MTTHILNFGYTTGQTLTAQLFELGGDTVAATASSVTEATNRKGRYDATFSDVDAGDYLMVYFIDGSAAGSEYFTVAGTDGESVLPWSEQGPKAQAAAVLAAAAVSPIHADVRAVDEAADVATEESVLAVLGAVSDVSFGAVVVPLLGQIQSRTEGTTIRVFTRETTTLTLAVVNAIGQPVDLSGATLSLIIERAKGGDISVIEDGDIAVNESTISFAIPAEVSAAEGYHNWALRGSDGVVLMQGPLIVEYAPEVGP